MNWKELGGFLGQGDKTVGPWCVSNRGGGDVCICMGTDPDDHGPVLFVLKPIQFGCFEMTAEDLAKCGARIVSAVTMTDVSVRVTFDPCALDSHDWRPAKLGIAQLVGADRCAKCGETRIPDYRAGGIDRSATEIWAEHQ